LHDIPILGSLVIIFSLTLPISYIFHRLKCPAVIGYLLTGIIIGPHAFGWITEVHYIEVLSEIGIVLLLFTIGMELSLSTLIKNLKTVVGSGAGQFFLNSTVFTLGALLWGMPLLQAMFFATLLSISSTAIVLKSYTDRNELDTYHGQISAGILLFQDLLVIPLMLLAPFLAGVEELQLSRLGWVMFKSAIGIGAIFLGAKLLVPRLLKAFVKLGDREMLLLLIILICMVGAWGAQEFGISLAMGAFIVGLILSESEYSHDLIPDILPFRDFFSSLFFISIGMMLQVDFLGQNFFPLIGITILILSTKGLLNVFSIWIVERSWYRSVVSGVRLTQVGEFSFVILGSYIGSKTIPEHDFQAFLACAILSMLLTPFWMPLSLTLAKRIINIDMSKLPDLKGLAPSIQDHVIIYGYGSIGQYLARILTETRVPFIIVDRDHEAISAAAAKGFKAHFGDLSKKTIQELSAMKYARAVVFTSGSAQMIKSASLQARNDNKGIYILVMSGSTQDVVDYLSIGVNRVISSEFEATVELFSRILNEFGLPDNLISQYIEMARVEGYGMFRGIEANQSSMKEYYNYLAKSTTFTYLVMDHSRLVGMNYQALNLEGQCQVAVISVVRGHKYFTESKGLTFEANDLLVLVGNHSHLDKAKHFLDEFHQDESDRIEGEKEAGPPFQEGPAEDQPT